MTKQNVRWFGPVEEGRPRRKDDEPALRELEAATAEHVLGCVWYTSIGSSYLVPPHAVAEVEKRYGWEIGKTGEPCYEGMQVDARSMHMWLAVPKMALPWQADGWALNRICKAMTAKSFQMSLSCVQRTPGERHHEESIVAGVEFEAVFLSGEDVERIESDQRTVVPIDKRRVQSGFPNVAVMAAALLALGVELPESCRP